MTNKVKKLVEKCAEVKPLDGRVLILPDKVRTYKATQLSGRPKDPDIKPQMGIDGQESYPADTEMEMVEVQQDVNYRYQTATVLQIPEDETRFNVGDTITYMVGGVFDFDLIKGVSLIRKYDVVAVV